MCGGGSADETVITWGFEFGFGGTTWKGNCCICTGENCNKDYMCGDNQAKPDGWDDTVYNAGSATLWTAPPPTSAPSAAATGEESSSDIGLIIGIVVGAVVVIAGVAFFMMKKKG